MNPKSFLAIVAKKKVIYGLENADLAKVLGVSARTFLRRLNDPGELTIREINTLIKFLKFTEQEKEEALLS